MLKKSGITFALAFAMVLVSAANGAIIPGTPVTPGQVCTYTDVYFASATTVVVAIFTDTAGNNSVIPLSELVPTDGFNVLFSSSPFVAPSNATTVVVSHGAVGNGTVIVTNAQLTCLSSSTGGSGQVIFPSAINPANTANLVVTPYTILGQNIIPLNYSGGMFTVTTSYSDAGPMTIAILFTAVSGVGGDFLSTPVQTFQAGTNAVAIATFQLPPLVPGTKLQVVINTNNIDDPVTISNLILTEN